MDADLDQLLLEGRRSAEKLREQQVERAEYRETVLGRAPTRQCRWCLNLYSGYALDIHQRERLRVATLTTGGAACLEPDICGACYASVTESAPRLNNGSSIDVGYSNHGVPNLSLLHSL